MTKEMKRVAQALDTVRAYVHGKHKCKIGPGGCFWCMVKKDARLALKAVKFEMAK